MTDTAFLTYAAAAMLFAVGLGVGALCGYLLHALRGRCGSPCCVGGCTCGWDQTMPADGTGDSPTVQGGGGWGPPKIR